MNFIETLLDSANNGQSPLKWRAEEAGGYIVGHEECNFGIRLNRTGSHLSLYTTVGYIGNPAWLLERSSPWKTSAAIGDGGTQTVFIDHQTGKVFLIRSWPRAQLDTVRFGEELKVIVEGYRSWSSMLHAESQIAG